jgi:hypothetical protein
VIQTEDLKFILALEPTWTICVNGFEFQTLSSSDILLDDSSIQFGRYSRKVLDVEWLRPNVVRIRARTKFRSQPDTITLYPGARLPSGVDLRRRRRAFQTQIGGALCEYFGVRKVERQALYSDRRHGIGGAYPRFLVGKHAVITVDPDETSAVVNGIMRAALLWGPLVRRNVTVVIPDGRQQTISARLRSMTQLRNRIQWLQWNGSVISALDDTSAEPNTHVHEFCLPDVGSEVDRICGLAPDLLQAVPHIAGRSVSIRLRGIEIARVSEKETTYPLGEPLPHVIRDLDETRRYGSRHPMARAHEERWLESNLIGAIRRVVPSIDVRHIYPQVPSFAGEERNIIDLLTITREGRLVVVEIKASADPDLPFQALDYWIAVERHRKAGEFTAQGYFKGCQLRDEPALLVLVAPLLSYHKTLNRLISALPDDLPLMEIGINQSWKKEIKILRRKGIVG